MGETSLRNFSSVFYLKQKATEEFRILSQNKTIIKMIIICIIYGAKYCIEDGANESIYLQSNNYQASTMIQTLFWAWFLIKWTNVSVFIELMF